MRHTFLRWLFVLLCVSVVSGCANVRWSHPTPSPELVQDVANDIYGIKYEKDYTAKTEEPATQAEFDQIMDNPPTKETRGISWVTRLEDGTLLIGGYSTHLYQLGLNSEKDYAAITSKTSRLLGISMPTKARLQALDSRCPIW